MKWSIQIVDKENPYQAMIFKGKELIGLVDFNNRKDFFKFIAIMVKNQCKIINPEVLKKMTPEPLIK